MLEFERKFLLRRVPKDIPFMADEVRVIVQYYLDDGTRYRSQIVDGKHKAYTRTVKEATIDPNIREEQEDEISENEFTRSVAGSSNRIAKRRYVFDEGHYEVVVDDYLDISLAVAEIEITGMATSDEEKLETLKSLMLPHHIRKEVILEVTSLDQFKNENLARM